MKEECPLNIDKDIYEKVRKIVSSDRIRYKSIRNYIHNAIVEYMKVKK